MEKKYKYSEQKPAMAAALRTSLYPAGFTP